MMPFNINKKVNGYIGRIFLLLCVLSALAVIAGCDEENKVSTEKVYDYSQNDLGLKLLVDKQKLTVADNLKVSLIAKTPEKWVAEFPEFTDNIGGFALADKPEIKNDIAESGNGKISILEISLLPFLPGKYELPVMKVFFVNENGKRIELVTDKLSYEVSSVIPSDEQRLLKDIGGVLDLKKDYFYWFLIGVIAFFIVVVTAIIVIRILLLRRARLRAIRYPHELALERLELLEKSSLLQEQKFVEFYTQVTDILRHYINMRFGINAEESTTEEFLHYISTEKVLLSEYTDLLQNFLIQCDLVKFAKVSPADTECNNVLLSCRDFVEQTKRDNSEINIKD